MFIFSRLSLGRNARSPFFFGFLRPSWKEGESEIGKYLVRRKGKGKNESLYRCSVIGSAVWRSRVAQSLYRKEKKMLNNVPPSHQQLVVL